MKFWVKYNNIRGINATKSSSWFILSVFIDKMLFFCQYCTHRFNSYIGLNNIKKTPKIIMLLALAGTVQVSANMLAPASYAIKQNVLGLNIKHKNNESMYLGSWKRLISNKINPSYFTQLNSLESSSRHFSDYQFGSDIIGQDSKYSGIVFSDNLFNSIIDDQQLYFSFSTQSINISAFKLNQLYSGFVPSSNISKTQSPIISQEFYSPGYVLSKGGSSLAVSAVLVQQSFLDDAFGSVTFNNHSNSQFYNDKSFVNSTKGYGYKVSYSQVLPAQITSTFTYQSRIYTSTFESFTYTYLEPGDFDMPSQYSFALDVPLMKNNTVKFNADMISYSQTKPYVHSGYSDDFLAIYDVVVRTGLAFKDLVVYSVDFEQKVSDNLSFNVQVLSRQQPLATTKNYSRVLRKDTAQYSYRVGLLQKTSFGDFSFSASFASKPLLFGRSEFGRISKAANQHLEGVLSWSLQF